MTSIANIFSSAPPGLHGAALAIPTMMAEWFVWSGPLVLCLLWLFGGAQDRRAVVSAGLSAILGLAAASILSSSVYMPRPFVDGGAINYLHHVDDGSFPSDHATLMFCLAFAFLFVRPPSFRFLPLPLLAMTLGIAWARIRLGAHYPRDIVGAASLAVLAASTVATPIGQRITDWLSSGFDRIGTRLSLIDREEHGR